jgi:hypothetical protein
MLSCGDRHLTRVSTNQVDDIWDSGDFVMERVRNPWQRVPPLRDRNCPRLAIEPGMLFINTSRCHDHVQGASLEHGNECMGSGFIESTTL